MYGDTADALVMRFEPADVVVTGPNGFSARAHNDSSFARDLEHHLLSGHSDGGLTFFAVSAPEPGFVGPAVFAAGALMLRRRKGGRRRTSV